MNKWISFILCLLVGVGFIILDISVSNHLNQLPSNTSFVELFFYCIEVFLLTITGVIFIFISILIAGDGLLWDLPMEDEGK